MIEIDCEQGSERWHDCRLGVVTASQASRIVTPKGKPSASREDYLGELLAESLLGYPVSEFGGTFHTDRRS